MAQKRAEYALDKVSKIKSEKKDFKSFSAGAPSMILQNGFGQSLAFWLAKGTDKELEAKLKDKHIELFDMVTEWLKKNDEESLGGCKKRKDYLQKISEMEQADYLRNQSESLALLEWVKRYANADLFS
jgi:CRISPR-associated protein Cmr5